MPTFADLEAASSVQTKLNNAITRTDWAVVLEDTTDLASLTYTTGSAFTVAAGTQVVCAKEGYSYTVQASGASSFHLQQGAVKLNVNPVFGQAYPWGAWLPVSDGTTDNYAKLRSAGDACRTSGIVGLLIPNGRFFIGQEFEVDWQAMIVGAKGEAFTTGQGTVLIFPPGVNGFRITRGNTSASGGLGDWSYIKHMVIVCTSNNGTEGGSGIVMDARCSLEDVKCSGFPLDGFHMDATAPGTNANLIRIYNCTATANGRDGFYFDGADTNASTIVGCNSTRNGRINFYDSSFLGNTYEGCHSDSPAYWSFGRGTDGKGYRCIQDHVGAANTIPITGANWTDYWVEVLPSTTYPNIGTGRQYYDARAGLTTSYSALHYVSDNPNAVNLYNGCYAEGTGSVAGNFIRSPATINGGALGNVEPLTFNVANRPGINPIGQTTTVGGITVRSGIGVGGQLIAHGFLSTETNTSWNLEWISASKTWELRPNGTINNRAYRLADTGNTLGLPAGTMDFSPLGLAINGLRFDTGTAAPTSGTWGRGDRRFNSLPAVGQPKSWVCTAGGTPGTWVSEGNL